MGLHDMLLMLGLKYTSAAGLEMVDKVMNFIKYAAYENSVELAKEKGPFSAFDAEKFLKGGFAKTLRPKLRESIREYGIRNCASLTIAPTGTTSLVCDVTSGIEPMFAPAHIRRYRDGDELKQEVVVHPLFKQYVEEGKSVKHFQGAYDLKLRDHFEMQRVCQRHIDNATSKTINVSPGTSVEELSDLYIEYFPELKGVTVYPEGSREDQPLTPIPLEDAIATAKGDKSVLKAYAQDTCKNGSCDV
jgi:ribonucleoside-diphosphate reductase alpha chain